MMVLLVPLKLEDLDVLLSLTLCTVLRLMENSISMYLLLCGGMKLTKTEDILANLFRFGRVINMQYFRTVEPNLSLFFNQLCVKLLEERLHLTKQD